MNQKRYGSKTSLKLHECWLTSPSTGGASGKDGDSPKANGRQNVEDRIHKLHLKCFVFSGLRNIWKKTSKSMLNNDFVFFRTLFLQISDFIICKTSLEFSHHISDLHILNLNTSSEFQTLPIRSKHLLASVKPRSIWVITLRIRKFQNSTYVKPRSN